MKYFFLIVCGGMMSHLAHAQWQTSPSNPNNIYYSGGNVGINTSSPTGYHFDVNGYIHTSLMFVADAPAGAAAAWLRGATVGNANLILQANAGTAAAYWITAADVLKIGATAGTEPATGVINITSTRNMGINTTAPQNMFDMATTAQLDGLRISYNNTGMVRLHPNSLSAGAYNPITQNGDAGLIFGTTSGNINFGFVIAPWASTMGGIRIDKTGNVLIGKSTQTNSSYILDINGPARANQLVVNITGADFVFDSSYRLSSLATVEKYIQANHHLPGIAPAAQMQAQGVDLGENQTRMLQKIEELTLYVIEQNKQLKTLKRENQRLEKQNRTLQTLEQRIERLEQSAPR